MKCDSCLNARSVVSENGLHSVCELSIKEAMNCYSNNWKSYVSKTSILASVIKQPIDDKEVEDDEQ